MSLCSKPPPTVQIMFKARFIPLNVTQAASQLKRSSHCLVVPPTQDAAIVFGGELQPRVPVDNALHEIALPSGNYGLKNVLTATSAPPPRVGSALAFTKESLWVWGGRGGISMECLPEKGDVWRFKSGEWTRVECDGEPPQERSYHVMVTYNEVPSLSSWICSHHQSPSLGPIRACGLSRHWPSFGPLPSFSSFT